MEITPTTTDTEIREYIMNCQTNNEEPKFFTKQKDFSMYDGETNPSRIYGFPITYK